FKEAERAFERADDFIGKSFRDRDGVKQVSAHAYNKAAKAYHLAQEVKKVISKNEKEIEQYMLSVQQLFDAINQHAAVEALDSHSFAEQSRLLVSAWQQPTAGDVAVAQSAPVAAMDVDADASTESGMDAASVVSEGAAVDVSEEAGLASDATGEAEQAVAVEADASGDADVASEEAATDAQVEDDNSADVGAEPTEAAAQGEAARGYMSKKEGSAS